MLLLSAATDGFLAYEGEWKENRTVRIGRFTESLVDAFCRSVRHDSNGGWLVHSHSVHQDLKALHRVRRPDWQSIEFEPSTGLWPSEVLPITTVVNPVIPVVVQTVPPEKMAGCAFNIFPDAQRQPPALASRDAGNANDWISDVHASMTPYLLEPNIGGATYNTTVYPQNPLFQQRIKVA